MRPLTFREIRDAIENWAAWSSDDEDCYPQVHVVGAEGLYRSPERRHHEAPNGNVMRVPVVRPDAAAIVEHAMSRWGGTAGAHRARTAIRVEFMLMPARAMVGIPRERWEALRAQRARMDVGAYLVALGDGVMRLGRELVPHRRELVA